VRAACPGPGQADAPLVVVVVEQAQLDGLGNLGKDGEVRAHAVVDGPERVPVTGPYLHVVLLLLRARFRCLRA